MKIGRTLWLTALAFVVVATTPHNASAESKSAVLEVSAIVPAICEVSNRDLELDLGSVAPGERQRIGKITVDVKCPEGTPYALTIDDREQSSMEATDRANVGTPVMTRTAIISAEGAAGPSRSTRMGTGRPDQTIIQVAAELTGKEIAGSYSKQVTLTVDW